MLNWQNVIVILAAIVGAAVSNWFNVRSKHNENRKLWERLIDELADCPPHRHRENSWGRNVPLTSDGIIMRKEREK